MEIEPGTPPAYVIAILAGILLGMVGGGVVGTLVGQMVMLLGFEVDPLRLGVFAAILSSGVMCFAGCVISYRDYHSDLKR
ncbi:hypothetical protein QO021_30275 (plasmid) [Pseudomonas amygdali pv. lachrymans]|uniref:hypothetical protein n=1 Tax=Pseudomonas amygdali TaxID=47877 RepID=UPI0006B9E43A|nr:hypothetical protein [Pseudomonas amygdali]KPC02034.1 Unknown protein sequence [Pseudomonas amygdali pv. lachrymans]RMM39546.1 hypothetical protein ALQ79_200388 [Pseudomonas amygdali pv. lachrymans]WIO61375.1 hypothetical protein QO021_30275 [Pseudomonas amygdali pv. lachrymans]